MAGIDGLIARPPAFDASSLPDPITGYAQGRNQRAAWDQDAARKLSLAELPRGQDGSLDYNTMVQRLASAGDFDGVMKVAPLARQQVVENQTLAASENFNRMFGGGQPAQGNPAPAAPAIGGPTIGAASPPPNARPALPPASTGTAPTDPNMTFSPREIAQANPDVYPPGDTLPLPRARPPEAGPAAVAPAPTAPGDYARRLEATIAPTGPAPAPAAAPGGPVLTQNPAAQNIPGLIAAASNPRLPQAQREIAKAMLEHALKSSDLPNDQKDYLLARSQGETDSYTVWLRKNKQAGATAITNDMRLENAESAALGKGAGERANEVMAASGRAAKSLVTLNRASALFAQIDQGKLEPAKMTVAAWGRALGADDATIKRLGLDPAAPAAGQALTALLSEMTIGKIGPGGFPAQNFSNADLKFLTGTMPALTNEPRANKIIVESARRVAQLDIAKAKEWRAFRTDPANRGKSYDDFEGQWTERVANADIFGDLQRDAEALIGPRDAAAPENNIIPPAFRNLPPQQLMQTAPEGTIRRNGEGRREIRRGNQWMPLNE